MFYAFLITIFTLNNWALQLRLISQVDSFILEPGQVCDLCQEMFVNLGLLFRSSLSESHYLEDFLSILVHIKIKFVNIFC